MQSIPRALLPFEKLMKERGYEPSMEEGELIFPYPVRGAFMPGDDAHVPGFVCTVSMIAGTDGIVAARVWLPQPVPRENYTAVLNVANEFNASSMLGSWDLNTATGYCCFRMWTYAVNDETSAFVPEAIFGQVESAIDADVICAAAYTQCDQSDRKDGSVHGV